jgi:hypothetical protein
MESSPALARQIHTVYEKTNNLAKQIEWVERLFKLPEFDNDYMLRYGYVLRYSESNNLPKAAEYAQLTLTSASLVKRPDAQIQEQLRKVRRACYHVIASDLQEKESCAEAISAFHKAIKVERYGQGYYRIEMCLDSQKKVEDAILVLCHGRTAGRGRRGQSQG